jgi:hypothetical protein
MSFDNAWQRARRDFLRTLALSTFSGLPAARLFAQAPERSRIADLVLANRILSTHQIFEAYGHVSMRSGSNPQRYFMTRSLAPEL